MKIETITVMQRKNLGNYEHIEISASAKVDCDENAAEAMLTLRSYVEASLEGKAVEVKLPVLPKEEVAEPTIEAPKPTKKAPAKKKVKEEVVVVVVEPGEVETPEESAKKSPPKKNVISYDSSIAEHKSIFGGYLSKKYDNSWKTSHPTEEIKSFTASLNGKEFIDSEGHIADSFLGLVHGFFGA